MDYSKNEDMLLCSDGNPLLGGPEIWGHSYQVIQDLATEPVSIDFFKSWARIDYNSDDALLTSMLKEARQYLEQFTQKSFGEKKIGFSALYVPSNMRLMHGPVTSIDGTDYTNFKDILEGGPYRKIDITFNTAWPELPESIMIGICMHAAGKYMNREDRYFAINGTLQEPSTWLSLAQKEVISYANITFP